MASYFCPECPRNGINPCGSSNLPVTLLRAEPVYPTARLRFKLRFDCSKANVLRCRCNLYQSRSKYSSAPKLSTANARQAMTPATYLQEYTAPGCDFPSVIPAPVHLHQGSG